MTGFPNVVLILADQLRRQALGCYGDPNIDTPHIDLLAAGGARFTAASSTYPVCVPYRFTLQTGEYGHSRFIPSIEWRMSPAERTLADELNDAGFDTAWFGKWHLYGNFGVYPGHSVVKTSRTPVPRRFQGRWSHFAGFDICNDPFDTWYSMDDDPTLRRLDGYQTDGLFAMAWDWIRRRSDAGRPFCVAVSVEPPHPLFTAPQEYLDRWMNRELVLRENIDLTREYAKRGPHGTGILDDLRVYYAMIDNFDENVGRFVASLGGAGLLDDTVIVLTADHGELLGSHGVQAKQRPWEESVGIPLIVADPTAPAGLVIDEPVCTEDLFPTLLGLAGVPPRDPKPGADLTTLVRGTSQRLDRDGVLLEFVGELRPSLPFYDETWRGVRTRQYKYTVLGGADGGKPWQFFDLDADPFELDNLVDDPSCADDVAHHHRLLRQLLVETEDHYVLAPAFGCDGVHTWDPEAEHQRRFG